MGTAQPVQIQLAPSANGSPIWMGQAGYPLITLYNQDSANTIYVSTDPGLNVSASGVGPPNSVPIPPQGFIVFPGSKSVYAVAVANTKPLVVVPGATQFSPGTININGTVNASIVGTVNANITGGSVNANITNSSLNANITNSTIGITTPSAINVSAATVDVLPTGIGPFTQLYGQGTQNGASAFTIAGGAGNTNTVLNLVDVSIYESYDLSFAGFVATQNTAGAALVAGITLKWFDDNTSGIAVYQEQWQVWVAGSLAQLGSPFPNVWGTGKMHGRYLTVTVTNIGGTQLTVQYMHIFGSPRTADISNWRQDATLMAIASATGLTLLNVGGSPALNTLGLLAGSPLNPSTNYFVPLNLFSGPIYVRSNANNAWANPLILATALGMQFGNPSVGTSCPGILWNFGTATGDQVAGASLTAIRAPLFLVGATTSTASPSWSLDTTMKEGQ